MEGEDLAPERVIGSAVIDLLRAFLMVAGEVKAGTFRPKVEAFGLSSGVIRRSRVQAAADSIAAGARIAASRPASMQASVSGSTQRLRASVVDRHGVPGRG